MGTTGVRTILYPVRDLAKAKELFTRLAGARAHGRQPLLRRLRPRLAAGDLKHTLALRLFRSQEQV